MNPLLAHHRPTNRHMALVVAVSQFMLMILGMYHRLSYSVPSRYEILQQTIGNPLWPVLHAASFLTILLALWLRKNELSALAASTGVLAAWSFLTLLWGLSTDVSQVSLAGPILGGGIATLSYLLTVSWASGREAPGAKE